MKRREFITLVAGGAAWPIAARAQKKPPLIGILLIGGPEPMGLFYDALRDRGYVEGKNIQFTVSSAQGAANRLPELAAQAGPGQC